MTPLPAITRSSRTGWTNSPLTPGYAPVSIVSHQVSNGTATDAAAEALDRVELRARGVVRRDDGRGDAEQPRHPADALRHVPGARRPDARCATRSRLRLTDRARRAAELERADRLQALELQPDLARRIDVETDERGTARRASAVIARARSIASSGIRTPPRCRARARARPLDAERRGGEILDGEPERLEHGQLVGARADPGASRRAARRARRECGRGRCPLPRPPRGSRPTRSASTRAGRRTARLRRPRRNRARAPTGRTSPTAFTCVPGASQARRTIGSRDDVHVHTTSAPSSASSIVSQTTACDSSASASACAGVRLQIRRSGSATIVRIASACDRA